MSEKPGKQYRTEPHLHIIWQPMHLVELQISIRRNDVKKPISLPHV
jgi:hypothetical protein